MPRKSFTKVATETKNKTKLLFWCFVSFLFLKQTNFFFQELRVVGDCRGLSKLFLFNNLARIKKASI